MRWNELEDEACSVARTISVIGDRWTRLILRDAFLRVRRFEEFERRLGITRHILADRLKQLVAAGVLARIAYQECPKRYEYRLTEKGLDLIPVLVEMANWSAEYDPHTAAPASWIALMKADREKMIRLIRETVQNGGSVFVGEKSLLRQFV